MLLLLFEHCISLSLLVVDGSTTLVVTWASAISNVFSRFSNMDSVRTLSQEEDFELAVNKVRDFLLDFVFVVSISPSLFVVWHFCKLFLVVLTWLRNLADFKLLASFCK